MVVFDTPNQLVDFLVKHRISSDQFLFMFLIYREDYVALYKYTEQVKGLHPEEVQDLVRRGYLKSENNNAEYFADAFIVTDKFTSEIFEVTRDAALEFWDTYPPLIYVQGRRFSTKNEDKEKFLDEYTVKIGYSLRLHRKVMHALKYGIEVGAVNTGIGKWFRSKQWEELEKEMNQNIGIGEKYGDKEL
jgi:hypothetical protein